MLRFISSYQNLPVLSLRASGTIATLHNPIIDPHKLQVIAFYAVDSRTRQTLILQIEDIRDHISKGLVINDIDNLSEPEDLIRLKPIIDLNFDPIGMNVEDTNGRKLGRVTEYVIDHQSFFIQRLHYRKNLLSAFGADLSFSRNQIVKMTHKSIIVQSTEIKIKDKKSALNSVPRIKPAYSSSVVSPSTPTIES